MATGRDFWLHEEVAAGQRRLPGRAARQRASALHPLHQRQHGQTEGHSPHHGGLPARLPPDDEVLLRPAPRGRLLLHRRRRLDHRAQLRGLRRPLQRRHELHLRRRAEFPRAGPLLADHRPAQGQYFLHRADRHPLLHQVGRRLARPARSLLAAAARQRRRADQSRGLDVVSREGRRQALPHRRYLVADRNRRAHDRAHARRDAAQARLGHAAVLRHRRGRGR